MKLRRKKGRKKMKKILLIPIVLLVGIIVIGVLYSGTQGVSKGSNLPVVSGWTMNKVNVESPQGVQVLRGVYNKNGAIVILSVVSGQSENSVKNEVRALAYEIAKEPTKTLEGLVGQSVANYIMDDRFYVIYVTSGKTGYVAVAETSETLADFLSASYGPVLFE